MENVSHRGPDDFHSAKFCLRGSGSRRNMLQFHNDVTRISVVGFPRIWGSVSTSNVAQSQHSEGVP